MKNNGELIFFCGKMGAGKSTKAREVSADKNAVLLCEDDWLGDLYPNKINSLEDYITYARLLKSPIKKLAQSILATGVDVVMDFPANTISQREWFRQIYSEIGAPHSLFYLEVSDDVFLRQIAKRRLEQPNRLKTDTAEMFEAVTKFFVAPSFEEGLNVIKTI